MVCMKVTVYSQEGVQGGGSLHKKACPSGGVLSLKGHGSLACLHTPPKVQHTCSHLKTPLSELQPHCIPT